MLYQGIVEDFITPIAQFGAFFLILLGVMWLIYGLHEAHRRKTWKKILNIDDWDFDITLFLKILTILGFIVGIVSIISGVAEFVLDEPPSLAYGSQVGDERHLFTAVFLIVLGLLTFLKPLNDLPIPSIVGLLAASAVTIFIALMIPDNAVTLIAEYINPKIVLLIIFIITFALVAIVAFIYTAGIMALSKIISWPPLAIIISVFCFIQGFMLLVVGSSLFF
ncbi:MAG: hypothetical protein ACOC44_14530 [Promethearchaeia archaeon]